MEKNEFLENIFVDFSKNYKNTQILKPIIIFTMGIPGSGKSTVVNTFICNVLPLVLYDLNYLGKERYLNICIHTRLYDMTGRRYEKDPVN